jgi:hypothetical protein
VLAYLKRRQHEKATLEALYSVLTLYPKGPQQVLMDYPGIRSAIKGHYESGTSPAKSAVLITAIVLAHKFESMDAAERSMLKDQVAAINWDAFSKMVAEICSGRRRQFPDGMMQGTLLFGAAILSAQGILNSGEIDASDRDLFMSEVTGGLLDKSSEVRSSERITKVLDDMVPTLRVGDGDTTRVRSSRRGGDEPELSGFEADVKLVDGPMGIALVRTDNSQQITQRRSLSQDDLVKIPRDLGSYHFVNLTTRGGDICWDCQEFCV